MIKRTLALVLALLGLVPSVAGFSGSMEVEFSTPAQANADSTLTNLTWALLVFNDTSSARLRLDFPQGAEATNRSWAWIDYRHDLLIDDFRRVQTGEERHSIGGPIHADVDFGGSWSSLYIQAESIEFLSTDAAHHVQRSQDRQLIGHYLPAVNEPDQTYRPSYGRTPEGIAIGLQSAEPLGLLGFEVRATGLQSLEWHDASVACRTAACPDGARTRSFVVPATGGVEASQRSSLTWSLRVAAA